MEAVALDWVEWKIGDGQPVADDVKVSVRSGVKLLGSEFAYCWNWSPTSKITAYRVSNGEGARAA